MGTILVIDDSAVIRDLLTEYLTDQGYHVEVAVDGQEGIDKALAGNFAVALCDLHMPRKNGYQVFTEVHAVKPEMNFIMTDSLPDELARMAEKAGAYSCLTKPFDLDQLSQALRMVLKTLSRHERT